VHNGNDHGTNLRVNEVTNGSSNRKVSSTVLYKFGSDELEASREGPYLLDLTISNLPTTFRPL
jgi:hypothetical protein